MSTTREQVQQVFQQTMRQLDELSGSERSPEQVVPEMLALLNRLTAAQGSVAWLALPKHDPPFAPIGRAGEASGYAFEQSGKPRAEVLSTLQRTFEPAEPRPVAVQPGESAFADSPLGESVQLYVPVRQADRSLGVMQVICPGELDPKVFRQYAAVAQQAARCLAIYLITRQSRLREQDLATNSGMLRLVHQLADLDEPGRMIHELANLARSLLQSQRAAVAGFWSARPEVVFADAVETNRKAVLVRSVRLLAEQVRQREVPMSFAREKPAEGDEADLSPLLDELWEQGQASAVVLTPVKHHDRVIAVIVAEYDSEAELERASSLQQELAVQAGPLLGRAIYWQKRPLRRLSNLLWRVREHPRTALIRTAVVLGIVAVLTVGLFFVPVSIPIRADARLEPHVLTTVTAPRTGRVAEVLVEAGQPVSSGDPLLRFDESELKLQLAQVLKRMDAERVAMRTAQARNEPAEVEASQLRLEELQVERQILERRIDRATLRAAIGGIVLTERPEELEGQTIAEGKAMLAIGDLQQMRLVVDVTEGDLALIERQLQAGEEVPVVFLSHAWPDLVQRTAIEDFSAFSPTSVVKPQDRQHVFHVTVPIELEGFSGELALANPTGRARLEAGSGSVAYRYFRRAWHFFRMKLWF